MLGAWRSCAKSVGRRATGAEVLDALSADEISDGSLHPLEPGKPARADVKHWRRYIFRRAQIGTAKYSRNYSEAIGLRAIVMKDFSNASFPPEVIEIMTTAFESAVAALPEPVHSSHITILAESILRTADAGERDAAALERIALMELQIAQRR